jgi:hypothetical protein
MKLECPFKMEETVNYLTAGIAKNHKAYREKRNTAMNGLYELKSSSCVPVMCFLRCHAMQYR